MTEEIWKDVLGYGGFYQVSNLGRVRSSKWGYWKILKPIKLSTGYLKVGLYNGKACQEYVHRLVAQAFLPNPNGYLYVNHKDEDRENNLASNLEWCTAYYNNHYSDIYKSTRRRVVQYSKDMVRICTYASQREASQVTGTSQSKISLCCNHKAKMANGYFWRFE